MESARFESAVRLSPKAVWTVFWFALFGVAALVAEVKWIGPPSGGNSPPPAPAIPGVVSHAGGRVSMESDAALFARMEDVRDPRQPLESPSPDAMKQFVRDLQELSFGRRRTPVRILHYGDSILTTDELSGRVRSIFQNRFGDAGHGFVLLARPWRWYNHIGVEQGASLEQWQIHPFTSAPLEDGLYGLGGVAFQARRGSRATAWVATAKEGTQGRQVRWFDISYLEQPGGGSFDVYVNDRFRETVKTSAPAKQVAHRKIEVDFGQSRLQVKYRNDGELRMFGTVLENGQPGVVYDSLAINGARGTALARYDEKHWEQEIAHREPSLVILMMGANEGANRFLNLKEYRRDFTDVVATLKRAAGNASCLVVGPLDQAMKSETGDLISKKMPARLSEAQRDVALHAGCAFFDTWTAMGGDGSMPRWWSTGLGGGDLVHPTKEGARLLGNWLAEALLYEYQSHGRKQAQK